MNVWCGKLYRKDNTCLHEFIVEMEGGRGSEAVASTDQQGHNKPFHSLLIQLSFEITTLNLILNIFNSQEHYALTLIRNH